MAVAKFSKKELEMLIGKKLTSEALENSSMMGCELEKVEGDDLEFNILPDRPDMLSIECFARALNAFMGGKNKIPSVTKGSVKLNKDKSVESVRPHISCAVVRNVRLTGSTIETLMQVQEKLHETLGRKRKKVAIGLHDMSKLKPPFTYKAVGSKDVSFVPLEFDEEMSLSDILERHPKGVAYREILHGNEKYPIIHDSENQVLSFPPIINGELTRVTGQTKDIFIDVTGNDERAVNAALNILVTSFFERGGKIETVSIEGKHYPDLDYQKMKIDREYAQKLIGVELNESLMKKALSRMDATYDKGVAHFPSYRIDLMHPYDIVEDIAIGYGYESIEPTLPEIPTEANRSEQTEKSSVVKESMIGLGYQEVLTSVLTNKEKEFDRMNIKHYPVAETSNSVAEDYGICRMALLPSLMNVLSQNKHMDYPQRIFEVGDVVIIDKSDTGASTKRKIAALKTGNGIGYEEMASDLDAFMQSLGIDYKLKAHDHPATIKGRMAKILVDGKEVGHIGEMHPQVLNNWGLEFPVVGLEIDFEQLLQ